MLQKNELNEKWRMQIKIEGGEEWNSKSNKIFAFILHSCMRLKCQKEKYTSTQSPNWKSIHETSSCEGEVKFNLTCNISQLFQVFLSLSVFVPFTISFDSHFDAITISYVWTRGCHFDGIAHVYTQCDESNDNEKKKLPARSNNERAKKKSK